MKINKTSHGINLFGLGKKFDLKIKSTREDMMDLVNENEKNGDRRNTYK